MARTDKIRRKIENIVILVITLVWAISFIADIVVEKYTPSPFLHMIMMGIVGALFGKRVLGKGDDE